ncbi:hypothetical protein DFH06DRAFT_1348001 [Mycena polygramma]|nr:hypothetical protein DFH06DRAFT_1348001 [Mycena polygramma]
MPAVPVFSFQPESDSLFFKQEGHHEELCPPVRHLKCSRSPCTSPPTTFDTQEALPSSAHPHPLSTRIPAAVSSYRRLPACSPPSRAVFMNDPRPPPYCRSSTTHLFVQTHPITPPYRASSPPLPCAPFPQTHRRRCRALSPPRRAPFHANAQYLSRADARQGGGPSSCKLIRHISAACQLLDSLPARDPLNRRPSSSASGLRHVTVSSALAILLYHYLLSSFARATAERAEGNRARRRAEEGKKGKTEDAPRLRREWAAARWSSPEEGRKDGGKHDEHTIGWEEEEEVSSAVLRQSADSLLTGPTMPGTLDIGIVDGLGNATRSRVHAIFEEGTPIFQLPQ